MTMDGRDEAGYIYKIPPSVIEEFQKIYRSGKVGLQKEMLGSSWKSPPLRLESSEAVANGEPATNRPLITEREPAPSSPNPQDLIRSLIGYSRENEKMCNYCTTWGGFV